MNSIVNEIDIQSWGEVDTFEVYSKYYSQTKNCKSIPDEWWNIVIHPSSDWILRLEDNNFKMTATTTLREFICILMANWEGIFSGLSKDDSVSDTNPVYFIDWEHSP